MNNLIRTVSLAATAVGGAIGGAYLLTKSLKSESGDADAKALASSALFSLSVLALNGLVKPPDGAPDSPPQSEAPTNRHQAAPMPAPVNDTTSEWWDDPGRVTNGLPKIGGPIVKPGEPAAPNSPENAYREALKKWNQQGGESSGIPQP
jgi:hypothetical protein